MELFEPLLNVLLLVGNIIIGMAIYWVLARSKIIEQEENIMELEDTIVQKDTQIEELSVLRQEQEAEIENLQSELSTIEDSISDLKGEIGERNDENVNLKEKLSELHKNTQAKIAELNKRLQEMISERNEQIEGLSNSLKTKHAQLTELQHRFTSQETIIKNINSELSQKGETIDELDNQLKEKINELSDLNLQNQEVLVRVKNAENTIEELRDTLTEKEIELLSLNEKMIRMQDDFTHIAGIGPKISSILREAGLKTFAQLANTNTAKIIKILENENPNLTRIIDPSTWTEQAKIAARGDWEALRKSARKR